MEAEVKSVVEKILKDDYVEMAELVLLLDWFDKVRISLWLAIKYRNSDTIKLEPKYYIKNRVRLKDRLLAITNCYDNYEGLGWTGVNGYYFIGSPTCFTMRINNVLFTNCSMDFIVSEKLGFPYPEFEKRNLNDEKLTDFKILDGKKEIQNLLFKSKLYPPYMMISQPIYKTAINLFGEKYSNDFVKSNSINFEKGEGKLFVTHDNFTYLMDDGDEISFQSDSKKIKKFKFNRPTAEFQYEILTSKKIIFNSEEERKQHREALKIMKEYTDLQLKVYDY